jgi:predicted  nucleic acid-binding Zn-ribbon protein
MVEAVLDGLERERPEWAVLVQGLQAGLTGRETVADIQPDLVRLEVKVKMRSEPQAAAARANNTEHVESELQALKAQVEQLSAQLRTLEPRPRAAALTPQQQGASGQWTGPYGEA